MKAEVRVAKSVLRDIGAMKLEAMGDADKARLRCSVCWCYERCLGFGHMLAKANGAGPGAICNRFVSV